MTTDADLDDWDSDDDPDRAGARVRGSHVIPASSVGKRLDQALALLLPEHSRSRLQRWLRRGEIHVDGNPALPRQRVLGGERIEIDARCDMAEDWSAEPVAIHVAHEDEAIIVIDKPAGLVVHPGAGNPSGTLVNGLLHRFPELAGVPRGGIVHRLDKDTSGLLVVARTEAAHGHLVRQLTDRTMGRSYLALVEGLPTGAFSVDAAIGRDPRNRLRMAVVPAGRHAVTHVGVEEPYRAHALLRCRLETGRTHQIRVHLAARGLPLLGDRLYGARGRVPRHAAEPLLRALGAFGRQALHAWRLTLSHPDSGERVEFTAPVPEDMRELIELLRDDAAREAT